VRFLFFFIITLLYHSLHGQHEYQLMGARSQGLGHTSACLRDEWAVFNNVGGLANLDRPVMAATYSAVAAFPSFNTAAVTAILPMRYGVAGAGIYRYGDDLYHEQIASLAFANSFGLASLGVRVNVLQYYAEGVGQKTVITASFGGITQLTPALQIGAHITNINRPSLSDEEQVPTLLVVGALIQVSPDVKLMVEVEEDIDYGPRGKTGVEYSFRNAFFGRTGFNIRPQAAFFGIGYRSQQSFRLDYALQYSSLLGTTHEATVAFVFKKRKQ
jgi:hypothetical protein